VRRLEGPCGRCHARCLVLGDDGYSECRSCGKTTRPRGRGDVAEAADLAEPEGRQLGLLAGTSWDPATRR